jgi:hypothetical protein
MSARSAGHRMAGLSGRWPRGNRGGKSVTTEVDERLVTVTGTMHEMNHAGDHEVTWDANDPISVAAARQTFEEMTKGRKYLAYKVTGEGEDVDRVKMKDFDPRARRIVLVKQNVGG